MATIMSYFNGEKGGKGTSCHLSAQFPDPRVLREKVSNYFGFDSVELTITFKPDIHVRMGERLLKAYVEENLQAVMAKYGKPYCIVLVGEHSPTGLFHYHGIFSGISNDYVSKIKRRVTRQLGRNEIKVIKYITSYINYMFGSFIEPTTKVVHVEQWHEYNYVVCKHPSVDF